jgi:undecaprenyl-diphosphatase
MIKAEIARLRPRRQVINQLISGRIQGRERTFPPQVRLLRTQSHDAMPLLPQNAAEVLPEKPGSTRDQNFHRANCYGNIGKWQIPKFFGLTTSVRPCFDRGMSALEARGVEALRRQSPELIVLCAAVIAALGLLLFVAAAFAIHFESVQGLDNWILKSVREMAVKPNEPGRVYGEESVIALTGLGTLVVLVPVSCCVMGLLWLTRRRRAALLILVALLGGIGLNYGFKNFFGRGRPQVVPRLQRVDSKSFPSGHALISTAVYSTLGAVGAGLLRERKLKLYIMTIAAGLCILIGLTRIYLGVHYPTDVVAGWCAGFSWALLCWVASQYMEVKRT